MNRVNITVVLTALLFAFVLCGAVSAATVKTNQVNSVNINNVGISCYNQSEPAIDGSRVVWAQDDLSGKSAIYCKNLATGKTSKVQDLPSHINCGDIDNIDISGTRIVWTVTPYGPRSIVYTKNLANGVYSKVHVSSFSQYHSAISGNRTVWQEGTAVYVKNLVTGAWGKVQKSLQTQKNPDIDGNRVVWEQDGYVYVKNLLTGKYGKVGRCGTDSDPKIIGTKVLWASHGINGGSLGVPTYDTTLYLTNLATGSTRKILTSSHYDYYHDFSGNRVVYNEAIMTGGDYMDPEIKTIVYTKNLITGAVSKILTSKLDQYSPVISGSLCLWVQSLSTGQNMIYYKNFATGKYGKFTP